MFSVDIFGFPAAGLTSPLQSSFSRAKARSGKQKKTFRNLSDRAGTHRCSSQAQEVAGSYDVSFSFVIFCVPTAELISWLQINNFLDRRSDLED